MKSSVHPFLPRLYPIYSCQLKKLGSWILTLVSFPMAFLVVRKIKETNYEDEKVSRLVLFVRFWSG